MKKKLPHLDPLPQSLRYRRLATGDIVFRFEIPNQVAGYLQSLTQPRLFIQEKPDCVYRVQKKCNCSRPNKLEQCELGQPLDCVACDRREI